MTRIDPVTAAVIQGGLENIAIEMGHKLMRMSYSSIIRESEDFGAALTDATGRQMCECKMSTPLQSGPIPGYVRNVLEVMAARQDPIRPGDVIMHNDPYGGASHGPDVAFCVPIFLHHELIGWSVTTAHHLDIGALSPGSCGIVDAVDTYALEHKKPWHSYNRRSKPGCDKTASEIPAGCPRAGFSKILGSILEARVSFLRGPSAPRRLAQAGAQVSSKSKERKARTQRKQPKQLNQLKQTQLKQPEQRNQLKQTQPKQLKQPQTTTAQTNTTQTHTT